MVKEIEFGFGPLLSPGAFYIIKSILEFNNIPGRWFKATGKTKEFAIKYLEVKYFGHRG